MVGVTGRQSLLHSEVVSVRQYGLQETTIGLINPLYWELCCREAVAA